MTGEDPQILTMPVLGDGLVLGRRSDRRVKLVALIGGQAQPLGTFTDVRDAWRAVDAVDLAALAAVRAGSLAA